MNLRDTLQQILTRVDYRTLLLLSRSEILQNDISIIINDNFFWHSRLEYLVGGQPLDWKSSDTDRNYARIYFDMERAAAENEPTLKYVHGASNLDLLRSKQVCMVCLTTLYREDITHQESSGHI